MAEPVEVGKGAGGEGIIHGHGWILAGGSILLGIWLTRLHSFLLFHSLAELFSIAIAFGIFAVAWNCRRLLENNYLLFLGIAYLFVAGVDTIHTLAYKGMGVFVGYDANLPTQLWIVARYLESLSFLIAPFFLRRQMMAPAVFCVFGLVVALALASIFHWSIFPDCFIEGKGLTTFKKVSEYIICTILVGSVALLIQERRNFTRRVLVWLVWSVATTVASELAFTMYVSVYGIPNIAGHLLKIVSFYLLYRAIIQTGLTEPYALCGRTLCRAMRC